MFKLKGTKLLLVTMILQIVFNIVMFFIPIFGIYIGLLLVLDTVLIIFIYIGFTNGKRGWAIFALVYGIISLSLAVSQGSFLNLGILMIVAGILGVQE